MATALETLQTSLKDKRDLLTKKETQLSNEKNDSNMIYVNNIKARIDREGVNSQCSNAEKRRGYQRDWIASDGQKWCGNDSTTAYYNARNAIDQWVNRINVLSSEIGTLKNEIKELEAKIQGYTSTTGGQKELDIIKVKEEGNAAVEKAKADALKAQAQLQAIQAETLAKVEKDKSSTKKIIIIIIAIVLILALAGGIFWYIKKRKAGKK